MRQLLRRVTLMPAALLVATVGLLTAQTAPAHANACGPTSLVDGIAVERWPDRAGMKIVVSPSVDGRVAPWGTNEVWRAIQACVPGLTGEVADSIYWQLDCHVLGASIGSGSDGVSKGAINGPEFATGQSWDLETWQPVMGRDLVRYQRTACESADDKELPAGQWQVYFGVDPIDKSDQDLARLREEAEQRRAARAAAAATDASTGVVSRTGGEGLFAHTDQWLLDKVTLLEEGTSVTLLCQTTGPNVVDYASSDLWDKVRLADGRELLVSDLFIDHSANSLPPC